VDEILLLNALWPDDFDSATVPFRTRSVTILQCMGYFDDWSRFNTLTEVEVLSWWNAGVTTVADIRDTSNEAIRRYHAEPELLAQIKTDLAAVAKEPWAQHVWHREPRFKTYLRRVDATVYDIATSGTIVDRRFLWDHLEDLRGAVEEQAALTLPEAVSEFVEAISGQHGHRLEVLLALTGLNGQDRISGLEASRRIKRSPPGGGQILHQCLRNRDRARPPAGISMPQMGEAERDEWPDGYMDAGIDATRGFFGNEQRGTTRAIGNRSSSTGRTRGTGWRSSTTTRRPCCCVPSTCSPTPRFGRRRQLARDPIHGPGT
jgi:hypothetical protein